MCNKISYLFSFHFNIIPRKYSFILDNNIHVALVRWKIKRWLKIPKIVCIFSWIFNSFFNVTIFFCHPTLDNFQCANIFKKMSYFICRCIVLTLEAKIDPTYNYHKCYIKNIKGDRFIACRLAEMAAMAERQLKKNFYENHPKYFHEILQVVLGIVKIKFSAKLQGNC